MRCNICDRILKRIIPDPDVRGGIRSCSACQGVIQAASLKDNLLGYDGSDMDVDVQEVIVVAGNTIDDE